MGDHRYLCYTFEARSDYGRQVKLIEIKKLRTLPRGARPHYETGRKIWKGIHNSDRVGLHFWSWIRDITENDITFYTDEIEPGNYNLMFIPEHRLPLKREPFNLNIR